MDLDSKRFSLHFKGDLHSRTQLHHRFSESMHKPGPETEETDNNNQPTMRFLSHFDVYLMKSTEVQHLMYVPIPFRRHPSIMHRTESIDVVLNEKKTPFGFDGNEKIRSACIFYPNQLRLIQMDNLKSRNGCELMPVDQYWLGDPCVLEHPRSNKHVHKTG